MDMGLLFSSPAEFDITTLSQLRAFFVNKDYIYLNVDCAYSPEILYVAMVTIFPTKYRLNIENMIKVYWDISKRLLSDLKYYEYFKKLDVETFENRVTITINERTKNVLICNICHISDVNVLFLPCGHLVTCSNCNHQTICNICSSKIIEKHKNFYR
jgi:hypothetical protein